MLLCSAYVVIWLQLFYLQTGSGGERTQPVLFYWVLVLVVHNRFGEWRHKEGDSAIQRNKSTYSLKLWHWLSSLQFKFTDTPVSQKRWQAPYHVMPRLLKKHVSSHEENLSRKRVSKQAWEFCFFFPWQRSHGSDVQRENHKKSVYPEKLKEYLA